MIDKIRGRIEESIQVKQSLLKRCVPDIEKAAGILVTAYQRGNKAAFFGNGGSAADAQHIVAELVGDYLKRRRALPALALHANTSTLTALSNDYGFQEAYAHQVEGLLVKGDVAVGLSTSGRSPNVLRALQAARKLGASTIGLLGRDGGDIAPAVDVAVIVPASATDRIQECHILIGHIFCELIENAIFP
jgi:D-sedoheptulose 7-phosphate isomerase